MRGGLTLYALNRGIVSPLGLARHDVKRLALAAQIQTNFLPRVLGAMSLRPGWRFIRSTHNNAAARLIKFIFATDDVVNLELTDSTLRPLIAGETTLSRPAVTTAITNGTFAGSIAGWTDLDEAGATSQWAAGDLMELLGSGTANAIREQQVVVGANVNIEHGIRVVIRRGPVKMRIGITSGGEEFFSEATLGTGTHSLSILPTADFYIRFFSSENYSVYIQSCTIEAAGVVTLPTPWTATDLDNVRSDQSGDVVFVACRGKQQRRIERRGTRPNARSWSIVLYEPNDGPFDLLNTSPVTLTPSATTGDITLTASQPMFTVNHVGALFSLTSAGQVVTATGAVNGVTTNPIRVTGIGTARVFSIVIAGNASASTVNLQRSYDGFTWANVGGTGTITADTTTTFDDTLDNQIVFYRLELTTRVAPDSVTMTLRIGSGFARGVAQVTAFTSESLVNARVLSELGGTDATADWQEGKWSDANGWPTAVRIHEGRLWWFGLNGIWGSISDAYDSFDELLEGSAAPINRTIGAGPVDNINWGLSLKGLMLGAQSAELSVRASSLDEVITPTNFNVKYPSTQGSAAVEAVKVDQSAYFVDRSGTNVMQLSFEIRNYDYQADNLMKLYPGLGSPGIVRMDVQRKPDTRIHCVRSDGTVLVGVIDPIEEVLAWIPLTTDGVVEDVSILPAINGNKDDRVYYVVRRTIGGATVRYLERWAQESECEGGTLNCQADSYVSYSGASTSAITGLSHLEGKQVVVWANGQDVGTDDSARPWTQRYTVSGGQIALAQPTTSAVVGLPYTAQFKSAKLGLVTQTPTVIGHEKNIDHLGLVLVNTHRKGLKFGPTLDDTGSMRMDDLPGVEDGTAATSEVNSAYDQDLIEFPGTWTSDMRLCLQAQAPRPVTVCAISFEGEQK